MHHSNGRTERKTGLMLEIEKRYNGRPIEKILADALDATGSMYRAAALIGITRQTMVIWCLQRGIVRRAVRRTPRQAVSA